MHLSPYEIWKLQGNEGNFSDFYTQWRKKESIDKEKDKLVRIDKIADLLMKINWKNLPNMTKITQGGDFSYIAIELMPQIMAQIAYAYKTGDVSVLKEWTE